MLPIAARLLGLSSWVTSALLSPASVESTVSYIYSTCPTITLLKDFFSGVGIFQDYYSSELLRGYSASEIAWIPSLQIFFMMAMVRKALPNKAEKC